MATAVVKKNARLTGPERERMTKRVIAAYGKKKSIREIADQEGRSYGAIHRMLTDAKVTLRQRGGATRGVKGRK